jgi:hypothetical protein
MLKLQLRRGGVVPLTSGYLDRDAQIVVSPLAGDPYINNVVLHLKGDGANNGTSILDSSSLYFKTPVSNNGVVTSSIESKYGGSSLYFAGNNNSQLVYADSSDWDFDAGDYTIEWWGKSITAANAGATYTAVLGNAPDVGASQAGWIITHTPSINAIGLHVSTGGGSWNVVSHSANTGAPVSGWTHYAFVREGNNSLVFINGTLMGTTPFLSINMPYSSLSFWVGRTSGGFFNLTGYLDSVRITKRVARYTANFNPETDTYLAY